MKRTEYCGLIRPSHIGKEEVCSGWVITKRDMGGVIFLDLRDREGEEQSRQLDEGGGYGEDEGPLEKGAFPFGSFQNRRPSLQ